MKVFGKGSGAHVVGAESVGERDAEAVAEGRGGEGRGRLSAREVGVKEEGGEWRGVGGVVAKVGNGLWEESRGSGEWGSRGEVVRREGKQAEAGAVKGRVDMEAVAGRLVDGWGKASGRVVTGLGRGAIAKGGPTGAVDSVTKEGGSGNAAGECPVGRGESVLDRAG